VSTLQALMLGYSKAVISVDELIFDIYSLKQVTDDEVKAVEQGKGE